MTRPDLTSGTVTLLFTDVEGSTRLLHALGPPPSSSFAEVPVLHLPGVIQDVLRGRKMREEHLAG